MEPIRKRLLLRFGWLVAAVIFGALVVVLKYTLANENKPALVQPGTVVVGHTGGPLLGPLYTAAESESVAGEKILTLSQFPNSSDVGYALLAGKIDAGFMETQKALALLKLADGTGMKVAGVLEFPYGATLVIRKDLQMRLGDLVGKKIAATDPHCELMEQFTTELEQHGIDPSLIHFVYLPSQDLLPALEAKVVDGVLLKGAQALLAEDQGHKVLFQKWEAPHAGDDCCVLALAQTEFILIVRSVDDAAIKFLVEALEAASELTPSHIRQVTATKILYDVATLERFPIPWFSRLSQEQEAEFGDHVWCEDESHGH